jgi:hypothetical protein
MKTGSYVEYNEIKNRVYLYMEGFHDLDEAERMKGEYEKAIEKCNPGFTVLADVSKYRPGSPEVQKVHAEAAKMATDAGVKKVARVVGETPLGGMQIDRITKTEGHYPSAHFVTMEEAEAYLNREGD